MLELSSPSTGLMLETEVCELRSKEGFSPSPSSLCPSCVARRLHQPYTRVLVICILVISAITYFLGAVTHGYVYGIILSVYYRLFATLHVKAVHSSLSNPDLPLCQMFRNPTPCDPRPKTAAAGASGLHCGVDKDKLVTLPVMNRSNLVYEPHPRPAGKVPAVVVLTWSTGTAMECATDSNEGSCTGFAHIADERGFLVVWPEYATPRAGVWGYQDDIPFFEALVHRLLEEPFNVDPHRVFVTGWSAGASMALYLQNEVDLFNAASSVEGSIPYKHLNQWSMAKPGHRTMLFQNYNDGNLQPDLHDATIQLLLRNGDSQPSWEKCLPVSGVTSWAKLSYYNSSSSELAVVRWYCRDFCTVRPDNHDWPRDPHGSVDATYMMVDFFLNATPHWAEDPNAMAFYA
eukprot:gnl/MRDRNA2_/MRDRNA2_123585_c0_seq1.p1 gnl/MRDRNA2_/MRDRNA2_123585_c0~~gnl/MRDRNA2_/MRDRNA2_123585_c0_seq1.p1  ORF type:complete len:403 (-),score=23.93 gnl/MRDRNA2_/MRDRNA2_123585_c0_seq1:629-1837(-)